MRPVLSLWLLVVCLLGWGAPGLAQSGKSLMDAASWAYQLQNGDPVQLAGCKYDVLVIDYSRDGTDAGAYKPGEIKAIRDKGKIVLAYLSIGEAEDYRFYWQPWWQPGNPPWLGPENPEWPGNYKVKYWYSGWWTAALQPYLDRILSAGFDGVYLDIIDAYWYWNQTGAYPLTFTADQMAALVEKIGAYTRPQHPGFIICPQNGESIIDDVSGTAVRNRYFQAINAIGVEDLFYNFGSGADQAYRFSLLRQFSQAGKKILNIEYLDRSQWPAYLRSVCTRSFSIIPYGGAPDRSLNKLILDFPQSDCSRTTLGPNTLLLE